MSALAKQTWSPGCCSNLKEDTGLLLVKPLVQQERIPDLEDVSFYHKYSHIREPLFCKRLCLYDTTAYESVIMDEENKQYGYLFLVLWSVRCIGIRGEERG